MLADYGEYRIVITSSIKFLDGHYAPGPSTAFAGSFKNKRGFDDAARLIDNTIDQMTRERFGTGFFNELRSVIRSVDPADDAKQMMAVIYTVEMSTTLHFPDGSARNFKETHERKRRLSSNSFY